MKYMNVQQQRQYTASRVFFFYTVVRHLVMSLMMGDNFFLHFWWLHLFPHSARSWQISVPFFRSSSFFFFSFVRLFLKRRQSTLSETSSSCGYSEKRKTETRMINVKACKYCLMHAVSHILLAWCVLCESLYKSVFKHAASIKKTSPCNDVIIVLLL